MTLHAVQIVKEPPIGEGPEFSGPPARRPQAAVFEVKLPVIPRKGETITLERPREGREGSQLVSCHVYDVRYELEVTTGEFVTQLMCQ